MLTGALTRYKAQGVWGTDPVLPEAGFDRLRRALDAGVLGYLLKDAEQTELLRAIQTVATGGVIFSPGIASRVLRYLADSNTATAQPPHAFDELTARERDILELLARGLTNPEIAEQLGLTPKTVSNNISNVLLKVQATDRAKLMLMALDAGERHFDVGKCRGIQGLRLGVLDQVAGRTLEGVAEQ